jgi:hypothetical protein
MMDFWGEDREGWGRGRFRIRGWTTRWFLFLLSSSKQAVDFLTVGALHGA